MKSDNVFKRPYLKWGHLKFIIENAELLNTGLDAFE